jgi:predicted methyltransferase
MKKLCLTLLGLCASCLALADPVQDALAAPGRLPADRERDVRSHPEITLPLLQLQPGDRVADIFAGGGYYSELIATIVGADGEVLLVNNLAYNAFAGEALAQRQLGRDMGSVTLHTREAENLDLGRDSLDAALIIMSYHDLYHVDEPSGWRPIDAENFLTQIHTALKKGARFLVVDHHAAAHTGKASAQDLHRIDVEFAKGDIASHGFRLVAESDALRNPEDDHSILVFDPRVRGATDRFILVFEKI